MVAEGEDDVARLAGPRGVADHGRGVADGGLGEFHDGLDVAEGVVGLEHGELGVVLLVETLVAEVAVDLVDAAHAAHQQPLEVEFGGDAHEEVDVEGVHVGHERPCRRAPRQGLEHRRLDLEVAPRVEEGPQAAHDARAEAEDLEGLGVGPHVDVALAVAELDVLEARVLLGRGHKALGRGTDGRGPDRQFAGLGLHDAAGRHQHVAQVGQLGHVEARGGAVALAHGHLDHVVGVAELEPDELAVVAGEHHAAGHGGDGAGVDEPGLLAAFGHGAVGVVAVQALGLEGRHEAVDPFAVRGQRQGGDGVAVGPSLGLELVQFLGHGPKHTRGS